MSINTTLSLHEAWLLREYTAYESLRMALMITSHHKYIQLSSNNLAFPIHCRSGMIVMLCTALD